MEGGLAATLGWCRDVALWSVGVHYGVLHTFQSSSIVWFGAGYTLRRLGRLGDGGR